MIPFRHALVTGGGTGVGKAIALMLAREGVAVTICGRRLDVLAAAAEEHENLFPHGADVTEQASISELYESGQAARGPFDIVIANAGMAESAPAARVDHAGWQRMLSVNLTGAFLTVQPALGALSKAGRGRIVFVASTAGLKGYPFVAPYVASKHGVIGLMRALATELAASGVTVNAVCPGFTDTDLLDGSIARIVEATGRAPEAARAALRASNPQGRFIRPEEVAAAVLWLCSENAASINGQAISVSGGETW